jgi:hypothetical protein
MVRATVSSVIYQGTRRSTEKKVYDVFKDQEMTEITNNFISTTKRGKEKK